jgi:diphthine-ammonia ligase
MNKRALVSWSGGKDSCYAAMQAKALGYEPVVLLNVLNEEGKISRSHGIPATILQAQAEAAHLPIHLIAASWQEYEQHFTAVLKHLKTQYKVTHAIFGDIDLEAHREWEEKVCINAGLQAVLPLWQQDRKALVMQMLEQGMETIIVSCNETMGSRFLGRQLTPALIEEIEKLGIDPCGENGEYHTLVTNYQLFQKPISLTITQTLQHDNYWFSKLELTQQ